jgi:hypothetical protein
MVSWLCEVADFAMATILYEATKSLPSRDSVCDENLARCLLAQGADPNIGISFEVPEAGEDHPPTSNSRAH